jgi:PPOX class probable F420-dependent enzyme
MNKTLIEQFNGQQYINVETFRKSGAGVKTPVWFVKDGDVLYVRTVKNSGKMKRLKNFSRVRVAPCDSRGGLKGDWVDAEAHIIMDEDQNDKVNQLLNKKYGVMKRMFDVMGKLRGDQSGAFEIRLVE